MSRGGEKRPFAVHSWLSHKMTKSENLVQISARNISRGLSVICRSGLTSDGGHRSLWTPGPKSLRLLSHFLFGSVRALPPCSNDTSFAPLGVFTLFSIPP